MPDTKESILTMKIGTLTYLCPHNYGAMFQTYGTKTFLQSKGYDDMRIIAYEPKIINIIMPYSTSIHFLNLIF